jgi:hypothetical protein
MIRTILDEYEELVMITLGDSEELRGLGWTEIS